MGEQEERRSAGCGLVVLYNSIFRRRSSSPPLAGGIPTTTTNTRPGNFKHHRSSDEAILLDGGDGKRPSAAARNQMLSRVSVARAPPHANDNPMKAMPGPLQRLQSYGLTAELDNMINDHQRSKGSSTLVRASSSNVMLYGNLGNIRVPGDVTAAPKIVANTGKNLAVLPTSTASIELAVAPAPASTMCRALSRRLEPEELKQMGNEEYSKGNYAEAIALYDRAIVINPEVAAYHCNKAAALMVLGHLLEAVGVCKEAIKIDPAYCRAHYRLANLYLRLGEAEKAINHYKQSGSEAKPKDIPLAQALRRHLVKCSEARKLRDWNTVLKEAEAAISAGANAAPQVFASQAEALLMTHKQDEAESALTDAPKYDIDLSSRLFGVSTNAYVLSVQAQVHMAAGRFEEAVAVAQRAASIDPSSRDANAVARRAQSVASARSKGNDLFKASKFEEACAAYGEGLAHVSHNAILLCNRAACQSKLGQLEKAIDDCNAALNMRPSYSKARLRRADCYAKLERWEASVEDYETLHHDMPGDEEISKALIEAHAQLKKQQVEAPTSTKCSKDLILISAEDQFRHIIMSSGLSVVLFFSNLSEISNPKMPLMEQLCKQHSSINFLKVDVEESLYLSKSEGVTAVPTFNIYKSGSILKCVSGSDHNQLEIIVTSLSM